MAMLTGPVDPKLNAGAATALAGLDVTTAVRLTLPAKPPIGVSVIVDVFPVVAPGATVTAVPVTVKLCAGKLITYVAEATWLAESPGAMAIA